MCGCWELNSGPVGEQYMLFTTEPFQQPEFRDFKPKRFLFDYLI